MDSETIPLCYSTSESSVEVENNYEEFQLTPGVAMFFSILKNEIFYVLLMILGSIYMSYLKIACQFDEIVPEMFAVQGCNFRDISNNENFTLENILYLFSLLLAILFFVISRKLKNSWHRTIYLKNQTEDSFTILISNIPLLDFPKDTENKQNKS